MIHSPSDLRRVSTLIDVLRQQTIRQPEQVAYTFLVDGDMEEVHLTYKELDQQVRAIAAQLQSMEAAGERALLLYPPGLDYIAGFLGCLCAGVIAVPVYPPTSLNRTLPRLRAIAADAQATLALTTSAILAKTPKFFKHAPELRALRWLASETIPGDLAEKWQYPELDGGTLAFLQYTSGSTAAPKGVMLTHNNLLHNLALIRQGFDLTSDSRGMIWLPPYHDMGLIGGILQPLYTGFPVILMSPTVFLQRPFNWLQAISHYRATCSGGPDFAYALCARKITPEQRATLDLSSWDVAFSGAEPVRQDTLERFATAFEPCGFRREAFYPCYGLAESTLIVSGGEKAALPVVQKFHTAAIEHKRVVKASPEAEDEGFRRLVGCGQILQGQKIVIADPETLTQCSSDQIGEIWVSGPVVAQGYWNRDEETEHTFRTYLTDTAEGPFLRTGDLGFLKDGELFVTGRIKDLIIIRGRNHYPHDIELTVEQSHPVLHPGRGAAFSVEVDGEERLVVVQEVQRRYRKLDIVDEAVWAIRQAVTDTHELQVYAVVLVKPGSIPITSSGKIQRYLCRERFLADTLEVVGRSVLDTPSTEEPPRPNENFIRDVLSTTQLPGARHTLLISYLQEQVAHVLRLLPSQVDPQRSLATFGLDSLMAIELKNTIETSLGVSLAMVDLLQGSSLTEIASQVLTESVTLSVPSSIPLAPAQEIIPERPLSHGQRALWFLHQLAPESAAYNIFNAVRIKGDLDIPTLQRTFQKLIDRHPSLRTAFSVSDKGPVQHVHDKDNVYFRVENALTWDETFLNNRLVEEAHQPFDLERGPLFRVSLFTRSPQEHILLLVVHHIVADFWSLAVLVHELEPLYSAEQAGTTVSLPPLTLQYTDYTHWQADMLSSTEGDRLWAYWQQQLSEELPVLNLPTDRPRPIGQTYHGASLAFKLSAELTRKLKTFSCTYGVTLYTTLLAAFQVLLYRYTGQEDIVVGSPTSGRNQSELAGLVGYFVNPLALRADLSGNPSFKAFLKQVKQTVLTAFTYQEYPFDMLVERLHPNRDPSQSPIFQAMFILQQTPLFEKNELTAFALGEAGARMQLGELMLESVTLERRTAQFDLTLVMAEIPDGMGGSFQYNSDLFETTTINRMLDHFRILLEGIVAHPTQGVLDLPILKEAERQQLLVAWNDTQGDYPRKQCLHQLFEAQATRTPENVAVTFENRQLTYRELNLRANQLAHYLQKLDLGPETLVGIYMDRSPEMIVGLLGTLKSGGAYVPLDPAYPTERINFILEDARVAVVLTQEWLLESLPVHGAQVLCLDTDWETIAQESESNPSNPLNSEHLAYVIYTSGSTGKPKGVQISHRAVVNFLNSMRQQPGLTEQDIFFSVTTLSFDIAALELFLPLIVGGRVVLASRETAADGIRLSAELIDSGTTVMQATPATWRLLLESGWRGHDGLKILCGGEAFPRELANQLVEKSRVVWNMYGPTETTIWSATHQVESGEGVVSIGRPIANTQLYLLDACLQPVPVGVPGVLYIGGDGLARGYFNRPSLTAEKFIPNPFSTEPGARLYNTGDLARYLPDGNIEFLGRIDHQVKIRGFRIELSEIESALSQHPAVHQTVVLAREDTPSDKRLVAYLILHQDLSPTTSDLRRFVKEKLPDYMVPSAFVVLDVLPLTPNGKVNRRALPAPEEFRPELEAAYIAPQGELEQIIAEIWQEVLRVDKVGTHDNFFDLGGHSLLMAQVHFRLREVLDCNLSMVEMFQYATIHSLVKHLTQERSERESLQTIHERIELRSARKASMVQQRQRRRENRVTSVR